MLQDYADAEMQSDKAEETDFDAMLEEFDKTVREFGFQDRTALQSFDWALLDKMKKIDKDIATVALYSEQPSWGTPDATTLWLDRDEPSPWLGGLNIHDYDKDHRKAEEIKSEDGSDAAY